MNSNIFNEKLKQLSETLTQLHAKSVLENGLSTLDKDLLKMKMLHLYDEVFYATNSESPIASEAPKSEIVESVNKVEPVSAMEEINALHAKALEQVEAPKIAAIETPIEAPKATPVEAPIEAPVAVQTPVTSNASDELIASINKANLAAEVSVKSEPMVEEVKAKTETISFEKVEAPIEKTPEAPVSKGLNDRFAHVSMNSSLNERFKTESQTNLGEKFNSQTSSLSSLLDLNKKMLFVNQLFAGNSELFQNVVKHIDGFQHAQEAISFMELNKDKLHVDEKKEEVYQQFLTLIRKKF